MTLGGLFSGIGGFELAAQWAGITPVWSNEIDPFCCEILRQDFNHEIIEKDIKLIETLPPVDIIAGGFPCQPFSSAGKRKGTADDRHLWPQMLRIIREVRPGYVLAENVRGLLSISGGLVFEQVCTDLETAGYEVQTFVIPACGVNAPHRRERVWIVAHAIRNGYSNKFRESGHQEEGQQGEKQRKEWNELFRERDGNDSERVIPEGTTPNTGRKGLQKFARRKFRGFQEKANPHTGREPGGATAKIPDWQDFPTVSPLRDRNDGLPNRVAKAQIKALGNAIVPQVAYQIFKAMTQIHR